MRLLITSVVFGIAAWLLLLVIGPSGEDQCPVIGSSGTFYEKLVIFLLAVSVYTGICGMFTL